MKMRVPEKAKETGFFAATASTGAVTGAVVANNYFPPNVTISEAAEVQPSLDFGGQGVDITYGSTMHLPHAMESVTPIVKTGVDINISTLNASVDNSHSLKDIASLAAQYKPNIVEPIQHALVERLATGATIGAIALSAVGYLGYKKYRDVQSKGGSSYLFEKAKNSNIKTRTLAGLCGLVALFGAGKVVHHATTGPNIVEKSANVRTLPKSLTDKSPLLKDATMEGLGSELPQKLAGAFVEYKKNVEESLELSEKKFQEAFEHYSSKKSSLINRPEYTVAMHISDAHCNYAMYKYALKPVTAAFQPSIVLNSGDNYTNGGTMPYEKNCFTDLRNAVAEVDPTTTIVNTIGNHDPKNFINIDKNPRVITPTKGDDFTAHTELGDIVVTEDKSLSTWDSKPPEKSPEMFKLNAEQGHETAEIACKNAEKTGERPIVMVHRPQASFETSLRGCARLILKGHTHVNQPVKKVVSRDGQEVLHHTAGSISGTHNTIAIYETPKRPATYSMLYFDHEHQLKGATTVTFDTDGNVTIEDEKLPKYVDKDLSQAQLAFVKEHKHKKSDG